MNSCILALDQGTTSSRAIIFDRNGREMARGQNEFPQYYPEPGWVSHSPMEILQSQYAAILEAFRAFDELNADAGVKEPLDIAAIGITNQRETTVVWDRNTGEPIYDAVVWQCRRSAPICEEILCDAELTSYIARTTGLLPDAYFSATKLKWILDNVPGARESAEKGELLFGTIDTWLIWNMTGGEVHATDYSNASRTMLYDIHNLCWDKRICEWLEIPLSMLPEVCPTSHCYGTVSSDSGLPEELIGVPIASAAGDQQAALFGQACFNKGDVKNTYGTGCFLIMNTGKECVLSNNRLLSTIAWGIGDEITYALEGSVFNAGSVIKWLRDDLGIISTARECDVLAESVPDTGGVYFVPAFTGLGAPYWDMYARGTIIGITRGTGRAQIARAVIEAIAHQSADLLDAMREDVGAHIGEIRVDGGASVSNIMMQFQADISGARVLRPFRAETTAWGAAALAGLAIGLWNDMDEIKELWSSDCTFEPAMSPEVRIAKRKEWARAANRSLSWADKVEIC
jgi:glycerol kinase